MKKLIPLLVIAAGAVAYNVYKNRKETTKEDEEKTLIVIDETKPSKEDDTSAEIETKAEEPVEEIVEEPVEAEKTVEETQAEEAEEPENPLKEVEEAALEVQEELGTFETLSDPEEQFERPSFFHLTADSYLEKEEEPAEEPEAEKQQEAPAVVIEETSEVLEPELEEEPVQEEIAEPVEPVEETVTEPEEAVEPVTEPEVLVEEEVSAEEAVVEETVDTEEPESTIDDLLNNIAEQVEEAKEEVLPEEPVELSEEEVTEEPQEELEPLPSYNTPEVDELMKAIAGQLKAADAEPVQEEVLEETEPEVIQEEAAEEPVQPEESDYLQDIRKITEMYSEKVAQYNIRYPYLSSRFIDDTLKFSQQFNTEYPQGTRVAIEHHAHFSAVEDLFVFAQIIRQSGYSVREGAEDKSLVVTKEMYVDTNTILHDVLKVANQVYCLSGEYQKFRITKR